MRDSTTDAELDQQPEDRPEGTEQLDPQPEEQPEAAAGGEAVEVVEAIEEENPPEETAPPEVKTTAVESESEAELLEPEEGQAVPAEEPLLEKEALPEGPSIGQRLQETFAAVRERFSRAREPAAAAEEAVPEEAVPEEVVPEGAVLEETVSEEATPEEAVPEEVAPEEAVPEEVVLEEAVPEEVVLEEATPEEVTPEKAMPEEAALEEMVPEMAVLEEEAPPEGLSIGQRLQETLAAVRERFSGAREPAAAAEEAVPEGAVPEEVVPEGAVLEETVSEEVAPEEAVPEEVAPEEAVPEEVVLEEAVPEEVVLEEATPEEVTPEKAMPEEAALEEMVPELAMLEEEAPPEGLSIGQQLQEVLAAVRERFSGAREPAAAAEPAVAAEETVPEKEAPPEGPPISQRLQETFAPVREWLGATLGPLGERISATYAPVRERLGDRAWMYGVGALIGVVIIVIALFAPPFALLERMGIIGYTTVDAQNAACHPATAEYPDLTLSVGATFEGGLGVKLGEVSRNDFDGFAYSPYRAAAEALLDEYSHLEPKSPLYLITARGEPEQPVTIDVVVPNDAEPWETLDLYTWTGDAWEWVGSELHTEVTDHEFIRARVTDIPANVMVMQVGQTPQIVSAPLEPDDNLVAAAGVADEVNPTGLILVADGALGAHNPLLQPAEGAPYAMLPTLGSPTIHASLSDVLLNPEIQEFHIATVVQLCNERGYAGVNLDYQGVLPEEREAYSTFVTALADALHEEGLRLTVVVESPIQTAEGWYTGGYDWAALGGAADAVKVPFPDDPAAYGKGGKAHGLLDYATAQVSRRKLHMLVASLSVEQGGEGTSYISLEEALAPFGKVVTVGDVTRVEPNQEVAFELSGTVQSIRRYEDTGTYRLEYEADDGGTHTIWLGTAANLAAKLQWAQKYHLGGVAVVGMLDPDNASGTVDVARAYRAATDLPTGQDVAVSWTVTSAAATVDQRTSPLTDPRYTWMVVAAEDTYTVKAAIAGFDLGSVEITVAQATPEPTPVPTPDPNRVLASAECLQASFVADVTIPDHTKLEKGEEFVKTWRLQNSGTCDWPEETILAKINSQLSGPESVPVGTVVTGETKDISVDMTAPDSDGAFDGTWELRAGDAPIPGGRVVVIIQAGEGGGIGGGGGTAPPPAISGSFQLGGHVRDMALPYADKMKYSGMEWAKVQVRYSGDANSIIAAAHARGFKIQVSALGSANMVTQPGFEQQYANWVAGMAAAGADAIEVWNEPNIEAEWALGHISPQAYANLLCTAYNAIKAANPNTIVISAATAPTGYFGGCGPNGCDDLPFLQGMYNAGAAQCMDYLGAHHNAGATSPSARSGHPADDGNHHHSWYFLPQTELYYQTFGRSRQLFYTEMGYASQEGLPTFSDWFGWARGINNAQQAAWLAEAVQLSINTGMVRCIIVWNIDFVRYGDDPQDGYAIVRPGGGCPACDSLHNVLGSR